MQGVIEFRVFFPTGGAVVSVDYTLCSLAPTSAPTYSPECEAVDLDFNTLTPGAYVERLGLYDEYGIKITAASWGGGYRPSSKARVFDTSNPGNAETGSPDLGSPNESCEGGGPGTGIGGAPNSATPNCESLGNALMIQNHKNDPFPRAFNGRSRIEFQFKTPAYVDYIVFLESDGCKPPEITVSRVRRTVFGELECSHLSFFCFHSHTPRRGRKRQRERRFMHMTMATTLSTAMLTESASFRFKWRTSSS
jgi:hypothetical protein